VEYKPEETNVVADALSRRDAEAPVVVFAISPPPPFRLFNELCSKFTSDPAMAALRKV
jgi:hypothetical protein